MKILLRFFLLCVLAVPVDANHLSLRVDPFNPNPIGSSGQPSGSFSTRLRESLDHETAQLIGGVIPNYVISGGLHPISASLTTSAFATEARVPERIDQLSNTVTYITVVNQSCWLIISADNNGIVGWNRQGTTAYYHLCAASIPALPPNSLWLAEVAVTGCPGACAVTTVTDRRKFTPVYASQYTTFEAAVDAIGSQPRILYVNTTIVATATRSVPSTLDLQFDAVGFLQISTGITITHLGSCRGWPLTPHFSTNTTGIIRFGVTDTTRTQCSPVYPQWWGALGDGDTTAARRAANSLAFNRMYAAIPISMLEAGSGAPGYGAEVRVPSGRYSTGASINGVAYVTTRGDGWRNTLIAADPATLGGAAVINCTNCRWSQWSDFAVETDGTITNSLQHCFSFNGEGGYGSKVIMSNIATNNCSDGISIPDDHFTNGSMESMYIRNSFNRGIYLSAGSGRFENIYVTASGSHGILAGCGSCTLNNIVTELTGGDGIQLNGGQGNHLSGIYLGDSVGTATGSVPIRFANGVNTTTIDGIFINSGSPNGAAIHLDGTYGIHIKNFSAGGNCNDYLVRWANTSGTNPDLLKVGNIVENGYVSGCQSGLTNDSTYITFKGIQTAESQEDRIGGVSPTTRSYMLNHLMADHLPILMGTRETTGTTGYPVPDVKERWVFQRERAWVNAPTVTTSPSFGFYGREATNLIGVDRESLTGALITGDSANFDGGTVGAWTTVNGNGVCSFTSSAAQAQGGTARSGRLSCACTGASYTQTCGQIRLSVAGHTPGRLYRLRWFQRAQSATVSAQTYLVVYNNAEGTGHAQSTATRNLFSTEWKEMNLYYQAVDATHKLFAVIRDDEAMTRAFDVDTFTIQEVVSDGVLYLAGGRKADTTAGLHGGAYIAAYGDNHATNPGQMTLNSRFGVGITCFTQATLPASPAGAIACCSDCAAGTPCAGGGAYMLAIRNAAAQWVCQ